MREANPKDRNPSIISRVINNKYGFALINGALLGVPGLGRVILDDSYAQQIEQSFEGGESLLLFLQSLSGVAAVFILGALFGVGVGAVVGINFVIASVLTMIGVNVRHFLRKRTGRN